MSSSKSEPRLLVGETDRIIALDSQPVLRNLLITQCYHDLSCELSRVLGGRDVNWCSFATWASKTAGAFIRNEEVPAAFRRVLQDSGGYARGVRQVRAGLARIDPATVQFEPGAEESDKAQREGSEHALDLFAVAEQAVGLVSAEITAGNLKVFSELGPVFARFVGVFEGGRPSRARAEELLDSFKVGPSSQGGQSLLRDAILHFLAAAEEADPVKKAQLMFVANAQTGLHEQIRLQRYIQGSLDAPIQVTLARIWADHAAASVHPSLLDRAHALWDRLGASLTHDAEGAWNLFSARELMTLSLPGQVLRLGQRLSPVLGKPLYPEALADPGVGQARELLESYDALDANAQGDVGASNWTSLAQRMRYILALFRSRQQEPSLLEPPFSFEQRASMLSGELPSGPL